LDFGVPDNSGDQAIESEWKHRACTVFQALLDCLSKLPDNSGDLAVNYRTTQAIRSYKYRTTRAIALLQTPDNSGDRVLQLPDYSGGLRFGLPDYSGDWTLQVPDYSGDWCQNHRTTQAIRSYKYRTTQAKNPENSVFPGPGPPPLMMIIISFKRSFKDQRKHHQCPLSWPDVFLVGLWAKNEFQTQLPTLISDNQVRESLSKLTKSP
jgi:hypothetical protein